MKQPTGLDETTDGAGPSVTVGGADGRPITRSLILQTALEIVDRDGEDGLSMRRLSEAVNRDTTVLYRHLPNKAAVLDGVAELVLPDRRPLLVARPLAPPLGQRPPGTLRPLEDVLTLLIAAGFSGEDALHIYRVLFAYLHGHVIDGLQEIVERPEETDHVLRLGLPRLSITEFPHLRALAAVLASYDGAAELDRGLDLLFTGLAETLTHPDGTPRIR